MKNENKDKDLIEEFEHLEFVEKYYAELEQGLNSSHSQIIFPREIFNKNSQKYKLIKKIYCENLYLMKSLIRKTNFNIAVKIIRKNFDIPKNGFGKLTKKKEEDKMILNKWWKWMGEFNIETFFTKKKENYEKFLLGKVGEILMEETEKQWEKVKKEWEEILEKYKKLNQPVEKMPIEIKGMIKWTVAIEKLLNLEMEKLIEIFHLPYNFLPYIKKYIFFNEIDAPCIKWQIFIEPKEWEIIFTPLGKIIKNWKHSIRHLGKVRGIKWINIKIFAPLMKKEILLINQEVKKLSKYYLPLEISHEIKHYKDPLLKLTIFEEMTKRIRKTIEKPSFYLQLVKKHYGEKEYERVKKIQLKEGLRPIEKEVIKYTSKEVAKKIFGTEKKAPIVRKIFERERKRNFQRFFIGI